MARLALFVERSKTSQEIESSTVTCQPQPRTAANIEKGKNKFYRSFFCHRGFLFFGGFTFSELSLVYLALQQIQWHIENANSIKILRLITASGFLATHHFTINN